jgi:integrase
MGGSKVVTRPVKTDAGDRVIPLGPTTVAALRDYLDLKARWREIAGDRWTESGLFFVQPNGRGWHPNVVRHRFEKIISANGLPPVRFHDLRHCAATYLRHGGADMKEVQETLGHANIAITADTYTSVILELHRANADAAASLIPRRSTAA